MRKACPTSLKKKKKRNDKNPNFDPKHQPACKHVEYKAPMLKSMLPNK